MTTRGPPPSAAGSSHSSAELSHAHGFPSDSAREHHHFNYLQTSNQPYPVVQPTNSTSSGATGNHSYYSYYGATWQNGWTSMPSSYSLGNSNMSQQQQFRLPGPDNRHQVQRIQTTDQSQYTTLTNKKLASFPESSSPPPSPKFHRQWDGVIKSFLAQLGLTQALRGFECDMLVMNSEWERMKVPGALDDLVKNLLDLGKFDTTDDGNGPETLPEHTNRSLDERKLDYVHLSNGQEPRSQTSINKTISSFLDRNRARNDASNRAEFLRALQKRNSTTSDSDTSDPPSCARTDAKSINRDVQMKYDIAKNEDGPLRRTIRSQETVTNGAKRKKQKPMEGATDMKGDLEEVEDALTSNRQSGFDQRLVNIETHMSVRYVPSPPNTLLDRLKFLEDHIARLEKDYPPWAALHFNQPNRGWPPPPRSTPIIVPSHLRTTNNSLRTDSAPAPSLSDMNISTGVAKGRNTASSLHRAVMERLEVQKAMSDLAGIT